MPAVDIESGERELGICEGGGHPALRCVLLPFVLVYNAMVAFMFPCMGAYLRGGGRWFMKTVCFPCASCWKYTDREWFGDTAIGNPEDARKCEWIRVGELLEGEDKPMVLYQGEIEPKDCVQGALGDCWFVAALACLSEHPGAVKKLILNREASTRGKYRVRFYNGRRRKWEVITVDDYIPVRKGTKQTMYMRPHNNEIWPLIMEKAMAKFLGSYAAMDGGFGTWATHTLTGDNVFLLKRRENDAWRRHDMKFINPKDKNYKKDRIYHDEVKEDIINDKLFNILQQYDRSRSLIAVSKMEKGGESKDETTGLVNGHLFSVISVRTAGGKFGMGGQKFVKVRNPWATFEWKGAWSDGSKEWTQNPKIAKELAYVNDKNDGVFWMSFSDFVTYFNQIAICDRNVRGDLTLQFDEEAPICGPAKGCVKGCGGFWCACKGVRTIYFGRESSTEIREAKSSCIPCMK